MRDIKNVYHAVQPPANKWSVNEKWLRTQEINEYLYAAQFKTS